MNSESLFYFVKGLNQDERTTFRNWLKVNSRSTDGKQKYLVLFDRIVRLKEYSDDKIRSKHFEKASDFYKAREALLVKIISCFSESEESQTPGLKFLNTAIKYGAYEIAAKHLTKALDKALKEGDLGSAYKLSLIAVAQKEDFGIDLLEKSSLTSHEELVATIAYMSEGDNLLKAAQRHFWAEKKLKAEYIQKIDSYQTGTNQQGNSGTYLGEKLDLARLYLAEELEHFAWSQINLAERLVEGEIPAREGQKIKEIGRAVRSALNLGQRDLARKWSMELSLYPVEERQLQTLKSQLQTQRAVELGYALFDEKMALSGFNGLKNGLSSFPTRIQGIYLYLCGLSLLNLGKFEEGHEAARQLFSINRNNRADLAWQAELLDLLFHIYKNNWSYVDSVIDSKCRKFRKQPYPKLVFQAIKDLALHQGRITFGLQKSFEAKLGKIESLPDVSQGIKFIDFRLILESLESGNPVRTVLLEKGIKQISLVV